MKTNKISSMA